MGRAEGKADVPVYSPHECICRQKAHRPRQQPVHRTRQKAIAKEQEARYEPVDFEFGVIENDAVEENPEGAAAADEDGLPPPVVVLMAEHDVRCHHCHLHDGQDSYEANNTQEAEHVIISALVLPEAAENEEEFNEDNGERDESCDQRGVDALCVPSLLGHGTRHGMGFGRMFVWLTLMKSIPAADIYERQLY